MNPGDPTRELIRYPYSLPCLCCGFPTNHERGKHDICIICWWEDDGRPADDIHTVYRDANWHYSLHQARENFKHHGHKYDEGSGISFVEAPSSQRRQLMMYVRALGNATLSQRRSNLILSRLFEAEAANFRGHA